MKKWIDFVSTAISGDASNTILALAVLMALRIPKDDFPGVPP
jgi:hypothetical protein